MYVVAHNASVVFGGGEISAARLLRRLQARGHRVHMLCRDRSIAARVREEGIPTGVLRIGGDAMLTDALRFAWWLRRERPDALLLTSFAKVVLAGLGARLGGVPRVVHRVVLSTDTAHNALDRFVCRRFLDAVVLNAGAMREPFLRDAPGLDPAGVHVVYDGVEVPIPTGAPGQVRQALGIPADAPVIGAITRFASQKRIDRMLAAFARLPAETHCLLAGEGPEQSGIEAQARALGVRERLHVLGFRRDVGDVLAALDIFVVSSDREGMAGAMLEAMAFGLPVVSTRVSGAHEALGEAGSEDVAGLLVGFDEDELAAACARLLGDPALRARMSAAGRRRAAERFTSEATVDAYERILAGISDRPDRHPSGARAPGGPAPAHAGAEGGVAAHAQGPVRP